MGFDGADDDDRAVLEVEVIYQNLDYASGGGQAGVEFSEPGVDLPPKTLKENQARYLAALVEDVFKDPFDGRGIGDIRLPIANSGRTLRGRGGALPGNDGD